MQDYTPESKVNIADDLPVSEINESAMSGISGRKPPGIDMKMIEELK